LIVFLVFGLFAFTKNIFGQEFYKWVDEKGTIYFSDNPNSTVFNRGKEPPKENGIEVLKRSETGNRQGTVVGTKGTSIRIGYSQSSGGSSGGGSTTIIRSSRS
jgi:hypothetical protein